MVGPGIVLLAAALQVVDPRPMGSEQWVLRCEVGAQDLAAMGAPSVRTFRIGPQLLQEWKPTEKGFGPNLCRIFACKADPQALEGVIATASVVLTLRLDRAARQASWRVIGASGLKRTSGPCAAEPASGPVQKG